jgi:hypothetical protein
VLSSGFEDALGGALPGPRYSESSGAGGYFGVDRNIGAARTGTSNGWIATNGSSWNALKQSIRVAARGNYRLTVWVRASSNLTGGYLRVRTTSGTLIAEQSHSAAAGYTQYIVDFSSGTQTTVLVHMGSGAMEAPPGSEWMT